MATQGHQIRETFIAGADLSGKQFTFVSMNTTDRTVVSTADGAKADGVLINDPKSGEAATVVVHGRVIVEVGETLVAGDNVAADANGEAATATTAEIILGTCVEGAAAGERTTIDFFRGGNAAA